MMKFKKMFCAVLLSALTSPLIAAPEDETAIRELLTHTWDKPEAKLTINPLVIEGNHAIADWQQNEKGGRALLVKTNGAWQVVMCGGDGLKKETTLTESGVDKATAKKMVAALVAAEKNISTDTLKKLASFGNVVNVKDDAHNQHHQHSDKKHNAHQHH